MEKTFKVKNPKNKEKSTLNNGTHFQHSKVDTLFNLVRDGKDVRIIVGDSLVSCKKFKTFAQADKYIAEKPYEILINVACLIINKVLKNENNKENAQETSKSNEAH